MLSSYLWQWSYSTSQHPVFIKTWAIALTVVPFEENVPPLLLSLSPSFSMSFAVQILIYFIKNKVSCDWLEMAQVNHSPSSCRRPKLRSCIHLGQLTITCTSSSRRMNILLCPSQTPTHMWHMPTHTHRLKISLLNFLLWITVFHEFWATWSSFLCLSSTFPLS